MKKILITLLTIITLLSITSCKNVNDVNKDNQPQQGQQQEQKTKEGYPITLDDSYGNKITIDKEPQRIISIAPNVTETIFALGKGDKLVGRTTYCNYPAETANIDEIGDLFTPNIEKIIELKPDLVITSAHVSKDVVEKIKEQNINVVSLYWDEDFNGAYNLNNTLGLILNTKDKAEEINNMMEQKVKDVSDKVANLDKPSVYYAVSFGAGGDFAATGDTFIGKLIEMAGGTNAAADGQQWAYSLEKLMEADPDIIIVSDKFDSKNQFMQSEGYKELTAVKEGRVFEINDDLISRQSPRLSDGLEELAKIIHPESFK